MVAKQKRLFIATLVVIIAAFITPVFANSSAYADEYPIPASGKCNGTDAPKAGDAKTCVTATPAAGAATPTNNQAADKDANKPSCAIDKIGWLLCPIMEKVSVISDKAFDVLSNNFLETDAQLVSNTVNGQENGTKVAWDIARNFANIMFVIAFLVIIISQVTSYGISNYGIKKMIPRLIVAAIAVNVSYYICQLAVDLSNILGYEIQKALGDIANSIGPSVFGQVSNYSGNDVQTPTGDGILTVIAIGALASAALAFIMLPSMLSIIPLILITIVTIIIILLLRKALIVLLVVISPIAFVLYLLPNTERLFSRWMKMFTQLLMVFPIVGMLFGAGQLASTIILVSGASNTGDTAAASCATGAAATPATNGTATPTNNANQGTGGPATSGYGDKCEGAVQVCGGKTSGTATATNTGNCRKANWTLGLVATGVAVAPLLAVWAVLKGALSAAGAIGGKISGAVEKGVSRGVNTAGKPASAGVGFARKRALENINAGWQRKQSNALEKGDKAEGLDGAIAGMARRRAVRNARLAGSKGDLENLERLEALKQSGSVSEGFSEHGQEQYRRSAQAAQEKHIAEEVQAESLIARDLGNTELHAVIDGGKMEDPKVAAAIDELAKRQDFTGIQKAIDKFASSGKAGLATRTLSQSLAQNNPGLFTGGQVGQMARGELGSDYSSMVSKNLADGILSPEKMAEAGPSTLEEAWKVANETGNKAAQKSMAKAASDIKSSDILSRKVSRNAESIDALASLHTP